MTTNFYNNSFDFTTETCNDLMSTCDKISILLKENVDGSLMWSQLECLADRIVDFIENPIVANSGLLPKEGMIEY